MDSSDKDDSDSLDELIHTPSYQSLSQSSTIFGESGVNGNLISKSQESNLSVFSTIPSPLSSIPFFPIRLPVRKRNDLNSKELIAPIFHKKAGKTYPEPLKKPLLEEFQKIHHFYKFMNVKGDDWFNQQKDVFIDYCDTHTFITNELFTVCDQYIDKIKRMKFDMNMKNKQCESFKVQLMDKDAKIHESKQKLLESKHRISSLTLDNSNYEAKLRNAWKSIEVLEKLRNEDMQKVAKLEQEKISKPLALAKSLEEKVKNLEKELLISKSENESKREEFWKNNCHKMVEDKTKLTSKTNFTVSASATIAHIPISEKFQSSGPVRETVKSKIKPGELKRRKTLDEEEPKRKKIAKNQIKLMNESEKNDDVEDDPKSKKEKCNII